MIETEIEVVKVKIKFRIQNPNEYGFYLSIFIK